ncbi:MAG TPA: hypothetical protein VFY08_06245, partial [Actinomycetota bacterium]|nr:hypothetical protein [Actinomycetota bacterium]
FGRRPGRQVDPESAVRTSKKKNWAAMREPLEEFLDGFAHHPLRARRADVPIEASSAGRSITPTA